MTSQMKRCDTSYEKKRYIQPVVASWEKKIAKSTLLSKIYASPYERVAKKEIRLAGITAEDIVLNIGCGALPFTALHIAKISGAKVIAIDRDEEAAEKAKLFLKKMGVSSRIAIMEKEGSDRMELDYSAVVIALQAEPKATILENLFSECPSGTRFIIREAKKSFRNQYDCLPKNLKPAGAAEHKIQTFRSLLCIA